MIKEEVINKNEDLSEILEEDMGDTEELGLSEETSDIQDTLEGKNAKSAKEILASLIRKNDIQYYNKNYSIEWLVDRLGSGKFRMPKYQRKYVWEDVQVTALIVSVLKKIPIPKLYGYYTENQNEDQMTLVIDGQQRLTSLFMYYWGIFPKSKNNRINYADKLVEISKECKKYYDTEDERTKKDIRLKLKNDYQLIIDYQFIYKSNEVDEQQHSIDLSYRGKSELTAQQKFRLLDSELEFLIVQGHNYSDAVELFRVYNSAGTPLSTQEIRNGIYQNNHLYKKINVYSEDSLCPEDLIENREFEFNENWYHFSGTKKGSIGDKKEIKKLLQLLSYYFVLTHEKDKSNKEKVSFLTNSQYLLDCLKTNSLVVFESFEKDQSEFKNYKKFYGRKGSLEQMINDYSEFCANNGDDKDFLEKEFQTIKNLFDLKYESKGYGDKINFTNLTMIYIILRANNKLTNYNLLIPREALYYDTKGYGLNAEGFYYRIKEIWKILKTRGVI